MRLETGDEVLMVDLSDGTKKLACATRHAHVLLTTDEEVPVLSGPGKGVILIKLGEGDEVIGARVMGDSTAPLVVENEKGKRFEVTVWRTVTGRGGKGQPLFKRGELVREIPPDVVVPELTGGQE
jgi:DNA gyrase subunit A